MEKQVKIPYHFLAMMKKNQPAQFFPMASIRWSTWILIDIRSEHPMTRILANLNFDKVEFHSWSVMWGIPERAKPETKRCRLALKLINFSFEKWIRYVYASSFINLDFCNHNTYLEVEGHKLRWTWKWFPHWGYQSYPSRSQLALSSYHAPSSSGMTRI